MRSEFIRIYKAVHTWTGIIAGMALFIAFYAGAITIFQEQLTRWASPPAVNAALPLDEVPTLITRTLQAHPAVAKDFRLELQEDEHWPKGISWQVHEAGAEEHDYHAARQFVATLEGDAARIEEIHPSGLADFIDTLHRVVGLPVDNDPSRWLMGVIAVLYALALVSGVIVLLPSLVKDFFALRVGKNLKRMWLDAHNVVGIISLPFHVVMALTAVVFAYHDGFYAIEDKLIHDGKWATAFARGSAPASAPPRDPAAMRSPTELLAAVHSLSPSFEPTSLQYLNVTGPRSLVRVWGHDPSAHSPRFMGGFVAVDPYSGKIINTDFLPGKQSFPNAIVGSFFALHFGTYGGMSVQWIYFLLGLAGAWLFYGGNLLWVETRRIKAARESEAACIPPVQRRDVRGMAAATIGVCLGAVCGISLTIVAAKWLHGHVGDLSVWHQLVYYAVFFGALIWSFAAGAARAAIHLLWLAAIFTFAIPATTLLAWLLPGLGMWAHGSAATLGVDVTALVGGIGFVWMARVTSKRVTQGPADSVWSVRKTT
ncbi:PepSY-associated TM helix domain-containing protein [Denitratisoma sp. agr-D3]